jgi:hypothetical protein
MIQKVNRKKTNSYVSRILRQRGKDPVILAEFYQEQGLLEKRHLRLLD